MCTTVQWLFMLYCRDSLWLDTVQTLWPTVSKDTAAFANWFLLACWVVHYCALLHTVIVTEPALPHAHWVMQSWHIYTSQHEVYISCIGTYSKVCDLATISCTSSCLVQLPTCLMQSGHIGRIWDLVYIVLLSLHLQFSLQCRNHIILVVFNHFIFFSKHC